MMRAKPCLWQKQGQTMTCKLERLKNLPLLA